MTRQHKNCGSKGSQLVEAHNVELSDEHEDEDTGSEGGSPNATECAEWQLVDMVALCLPGHAEADVRDVDGELVVVKRSVSL